MAHKVISFKERDIRTVIHESGDLLIAIWAPQLRSNPSYWLIGTSTVSRVKINALCSEEYIRTEDATEIAGTSSEYFEKVKTIGSTIIDICDEFSIQVHVTGSRNIAPFIADGILGTDTLRKNGWHFDKRRAHLYFPDSFCIPTMPGSIYIPDYVTKLREHLDKAEDCRKNGNWTVISPRLKQLKDHLSATVTNDDRNQTLAILEDYADCLYLPFVDKLGTSKSLQYRILTCHDKPIYINQPAHSNEYWNEIETIASDLLRQGLIKGNSTSPYNFGVYLQDKKSDSQGRINKRLIVDYAKLNGISEVEKYDLPTIISVVEQLYGSKYFSVLDLASASYQIDLKPEDRKKTAFTTRSGRYEFQRMPVQIKNGSQYMQRLMDKLFGNMKKFVFVCHDDILVHTRTMEEHEVKIRQVLSRLRNERLKLRAGKCQLFRKTVQYLGHMLTEDFWYPNPEIIERMTYHNLPTTFDEMRNFLSLGTTISRFILNFAGRAKPIWEIVNNEGSAWTIEALDNFKSLQKDIQDGLLLYYPDSTRPFMVKTGATDFGIYAILQQVKLTKPTGSVIPISCASRTYRPSEAKYNDSAKKGLALDYGMNTFAAYNPKPNTLE